jgi:hypothetical protein
MPGQCSGKTRERYSWADPDVPARPENSPYTQPDFCQDRG